MQSAGIIAVSIGTLWLACVLTWGRFADNDVAVQPQAI
jgi:hypothetical protein